MKKEKIYVVIGLVVMLLVGTGISLSISNDEIHYDSVDDEIVDEEINFVELYFPNIPTGNSPLGNSVFALSFKVEQYQCGWQNYGGKNLVASVVSGPYNIDRILGMDYNYFVGPDDWTNYNVTLFVRDGILVSYDIEELPREPIVWNPGNFLE